MPSYQWRSPYPYQKAGPKQFGVSLVTNDLTRLLDFTAGALAQINGGRLWRTDGRRLRRPEVCEEAVEISASAEYKGASREPRLLTLQAVVQPSLDGRQVGLALAVGDSGNGFGMTWMDQVSETICATTVLHIGESIYYRFTGHPSNQNPCLRWTFLQGAWHSGGYVNYGGWDIELSQQ